MHGSYLNNSKEGENLTSLKPLSSTTDSFGETCTGGMISSHEDSSSESPPSKKMKVTNVSSVAESCACGGSSSVLTEETGDDSTHRRKSSELSISDTTSSLCKDSERTIHSGDLPVPFSAQASGDLLGILQVVEDYSRVSCMDDKSCGGRSSCFSQATGGDLPMCRGGPGEIDVLEDRDIGFVGHLSIVTLPHWGCGPIH